MSSLLEKLSESDPLIRSITAHVDAHMSGFDASHDMNHIYRVVGLAKHLYTLAPDKPALCHRTVILAALLHDVGDRKYVQPHDDPWTMVRGLLLAHGAAPALADAVQAICLAVGYTAETTTRPELVQETLRAHPELAVVQDADRIDALGAVGVARVFTYGGARDRAGGLGGSVAHFGEKLLKLAAMMKTAEGRRLAGERTERMRAFLGWWEEEAAMERA